MRVHTKRRICAWISGVAFLMMLAAIGSVEQGSVGLLPGMVRAGAFLAVFAAAAYKGGYMR